MCAEKNKKPEKETQHEITISELLSSVSESEYPQYILDAISRVQEWMHDIADDDGDSDDDIFQAIFGENYEDGNPGIDSLIESLDDLGEYADVVPSARTLEGKSDAVIISITPPEYESGLRSAIDYAAVFNRDTCKRVWVISDTFILDDVMKYSPHIDSLYEQGITLRYILVTPWGWVELPLSGKTASKHTLLWRNDGVHDENPAQRTRQKRKNS